MQKQEVAVKDDGNCFYESIAFALRLASLHTVRSSIADWLARNAHFELQVRYATGVTAWDLTRCLGGVATR